MGKAKSRHVGVDHSGDNGLPQITISKLSRQQNNESQQGLFILKPVPARASCSNRLPCYQDIRTTGKKTQSFYRSHTQGMGAGIGAQISSGAQEHKSASNEVTADNHIAVLGQQHLPCKRYALSGLFRPPMLK
eukprot:GHVU01109157.1.p1 GENE.GHVU01109157.1~~GHVU01109157.1.p1  ORF type:complete len:154 (-),score=8.02 GHVU01109157.1:303-701(-)